MADAFEEYTNATRKDSYINEQKAQEVRINTKKLPDLKTLLVWCLLVLLAILAWFLYSNTNNETKTVEKIVYKTRYKTKVVPKIRYKTTIKEVPVVKEISDTRLLMDLKKENAILRRRLADRDKQLQLHKDVINKFFIHTKNGRLILKTTY